MNFGECGDKVSEGEDCPMFIIDDDENMDNETEIN